MICSLPASVSWWQLFLIPQRLLGVNLFGATFKCVKIHLQIKLPCRRLKSSVVSFFFPVMVVLTVHLKLFVGFVALRRKANFCLRRLVFECIWKRSCAYCENSKSEGEGSGEACQQLRQVLRSGAVLRVVIRLAWLRWSLTKSPPASKRKARKEHQSSTGTTWLARDRGGLGRHLRVPL